MRIENDDYGLIRAEEIALKRALYASLREQQDQNGNEESKEQPQSHTDDIIDIISEDGQDRSSVTPNNSEDDYSDKDKEYDTSPSGKINRKSPFEKITNSPRAQRKYPSNRTCSQAKTCLSLKYNKETNQNGSKVYTEDLVNFLCYKEYPKLPSSLLKLKSSTETNMQGHINEKRTKIVKPDTTSVVCNSQHDLRIDDKSSSKTETSPSSTCLPSVANNIEEVSYESSSRKRKESKQRHREIVNRLEACSSSEYTSTTSTLMSEIYPATSLASINPALLLKPTPLYPFPPPVVHPSNSPTFSNYPLYNYPSVPQPYSYMQLNSCPDNAKPMVHSMPMKSNEYIQVPKKRKSMEYDNSESAKLVKNNKGRVAKVTNQGSFNDQEKLGKSFLDQTKEKYDKEGSIEIGMETPSHSKVYDNKMHKTKQRRSTELTVTKTTVEAPTFKPSKEEFSDPANFLDSICSRVKEYGICKITPPNDWEPECKVNDNIHFTSNVQYVEQLFQRFGPNSEQLDCIRKHLMKEGIELKQIPSLGGIDIDLPRLSKVIKELGGLQQVINKNKWNKVCEALYIPKTVPHRVTKIQDDYYKYLLSYDMLEDDEKTNILEFCRKEEEKTKDNDPLEIDLCDVQGRSFALSSFRRMAYNFSETVSKTKHLPKQLENEFWKLVENREFHVSVHSVTLDTKAHGRHSWNLCLLNKNKNFISHHFGPVSDLTTPRLNIGMLYSSTPWSFSEYGFSIMNYCHTGSPRIWYCVSSRYAKRLEKAIKFYTLKSCNKEYHPSVLIPPSILAKMGVPVYRIVQEPKEFIVILPSVYYTFTNCGYNCSEEVQFATTNWLTDGVKICKELMTYKKLHFSIERAIICMSAASHTYLFSVKKCAHFYLESKTKHKVDPLSLLPNDQKCGRCEKIICLSMVIGMDENICLNDALKVLEQENIKRNKLRIICYMKLDYIDELLKKLQSRIE
ncbi:uncharacterized protein TRIADDRAFT_55681 [Trichoplax adhaerens]|uniref:Protein Jumonji n=1 Tax=Trichoplax adhaerens TaxID=10228 RepID=B3RVK0_TRIAD|nr:hypothetical protein TRIADDRAFT_55681 [Trichoplax adhaerens]EDV26010.1 hypothetical protein TRIADDRAFT_55681 [Trichoplax adhaerens]|eukprot:XP_002112043.1 hypothetical protein TRIADDRAFT_55681 [Trichoplax adhaerens]